jgi:hypothetical protein
MGLLWLRALDTWKVHHSLNGILCTSLGEDHIKMTNSWNAQNPKFEIKCLLILELSQDS